MFKIETSNKAGISGKRWAFQSQIAGHYASWAIRQSPYPVPDNLEQVIKDFISYTSDKFNSHGMANLTQDEIRDMVLEHISTCDQAKLWNERKSGNQAPYNFTSRYWKINPDDDFIDLDALAMNIARSVQEENAEF
jgi:hypothetical protein